VITPGVQHGLLLQQAYYIFDEYTTKFNIRCNQKLISANMTERQSTTKRIVLLGSIVAMVIAARFDLSASFVILTPSAFDKVIYVYDGRGVIF
jgi:hypothetical protein